MYKIHHAAPLILVSISTLAIVPSLPANRPNFVIILADDLGYGDLGCYGSPTHQTPAIDQLARRGLRFTDFHSNGPMCSATRAALLTGCYQARFGPRFDGALGPSPSLDNGLPLAAVTLAEVLRDAGYVTGMFGKWHLGYNRTLWPTRQGFDEFIGLGSGDGDHHTRVDRSGQPDWWRGDQPFVEEGYTTELITQHSTDFLKRHRRRPFFLFVSHLAIHFPWQGPNDPPHRVVGTRYDNDKWGILPDRNNVAPHVRAMIAALDQSVGQIVATLQAEGLSEQTLLIFASDNGGYRHYGDTHANISSNGVLRGQKTELHEGGHRVPAVAYWPGRIAPGRTSHDTIMSMDLFPTLIRLSQAQPPASQPSDGIDISSVLFDSGTLDPDRKTFWRMRAARVARQGNWKLNLTEPDRPALYDLKNDLSESKNLADRHPDIVQRLRQDWHDWDREMVRGFQRR